MTVRAHDDVALQVVGLQSFLSTPFTAEGEIDLPRLREHLDWVFDPAGRSPAGCFPACGAGEVWSLDLDEYARIVETAVQAVGARVPVIAGVGYGTRMARSMAQTAAALGADGILIFPPYLTAGPPDGLFDHYRTIAESVDIAVLIYQREGARLDRQTILRLAAIPNVIGLKDGTGDLAIIDSLRTDLGDRFLLGNGMPVAETWAPAYLEHGVRSYSPGGIDFLPELAWPFDDALARGDTELVERILDEFFRPLKALRERQVGYGVSINKTALAIRNLPIGDPRAPLIPLKPEDRDDLSTLLERGLELAADVSGKSRTNLLLR
ncbi:MAG: 5-dehydro-4-deoxyglucarate dehydratase [Thermomicrobiales bacterium]|nr:5-dehydro-4-deoxyglucarate dehydratase [Thermomicrobiales bacterium]